MKLSSQQTLPRNEVPPHLFAASDGAYAQMMNNSKDQVKMV